MLLHSLPLDRSELSSLSADEPAFETTHFKPLSLRHWTTAILCLDLIAVAALALSLPGFSWQGQGLLQRAGMLAGSIMVWLFAAHAQGLYRRATIVADRGALLKAVTTCAIGFGAMLLFAMAAHPAHTAIVRGAAAMMCAAGAWVVAAHAGWQAYLRWFLRRGYCLDRALVLAGSAAAARYAASAIERRHDGRIRVAASAPIPGAPFSPSFAWIEEIVQSKMADRIVIADCDTVGDGYAAILPALMRLGVDVTLVPAREFFGLLPVRVTPAGHIAADIVATWPLSAGEAFAKRIEDILVALAALLVSAPFLLLIALIIKIDSPGPVLFFQRRIGLRGTVFQMWKFRTMHHHMADSNSSRQTSRDDRRVTRAGRLLRRTSLDELPQLINVLRGDMSVVGPRPHALGMTVSGRDMTDLAEGYNARHMMKPGITGWAQVNGCRGEIDSERKLRRRLALDCHYIENWSLRTDAWIIFRTAMLIVFDRHAY